MVQRCIRDLKIGMTIESEVFLLAESSLREARTGSPYLRATLADKTGCIEARYWDVPGDIISHPKIGSGLHIDGVVEGYRLGSGQCQDRIGCLEPMGVLDLGDLSPRARRDSVEMRRELRQICQDIENPWCKLLRVGPCHFR